MHNRTDVSRVLASLQLGNGGEQGRNLQPQPQAGRWRSTAAREFKGAAADCVDDPHRRVDGSVHAQYVQAERLTANECRIEVLR